MSDVKVVEYLLQKILDEILSRKKTNTNSSGKRIFLFRTDNFVVQVYVNRVRTKEFLFDNHSCYLAIGCRWI